MREIGSLCFDGGGQWGRGRVHVTDSSTARLLAPRSPLATVLLSRIAFHQNAADVKDQIPNAHVHVEAQTICQGESKRGALKGTTYKLPTPRALLKGTKPTFSQTLPAAWTGSYPKFCTRDMFSRTPKPSIHRGRTKVHLLRLLRS
jgi:hypothetical protein